MLSSASKQKHNSMGNIYILTILAMMITVSTSFLELQKHRQHIPNSYKGDKYDSFNIRGCGDGSQRCSSNLGINDIDRAKLLDIASDLLQEAGYQPFTKLFVFKGKKKKQVKWQPWVLYSKEDANVLIGRK